MAEDTADKKTFKVLEEQRDWADREQSRLKKPGTSRVTQSDLFGLMREAYNRQLGLLSKDPDAALIAKHKDLVREFALWLEEPKATESHIWREYITDFLSKRAKGRNRSGQ